ncbi:TolC family protein [Granulicella arctica]|uniref:Outer membrane protein TolC n=1 Tax=Granulicella arctica TaxID=940613 RepID=A0A7Y9PE88_9BACT|nr:TolC family protein [Granulicella arctica]NYF78259.1 outer membrane protein TolC [Granulicella arctica]
MAVLCWMVGFSAQAQDASGLPSAPTPAAGVLTATAPVTKLAGDVVVEKETDGPLSLSIDDAIALGLKRNLQVELGVQNERRVKGEVLTVGNALLPSVTAKLSTGTQEVNLAAMGFKPSLLAEFGLTDFKTIVKVDTTSAQLKVDQQLFNVPAYYLYRSAQKAVNAASFATLNARGSVALSVGSEYLRALADSSQISNAQALLKADEVVLKQAVDSHAAGVGTNLDVLRARVAYQQQQQVLINDENAFAKDKIALNRLMGLPAGQELRLTDPVPFDQMTAMPLVQARDLAYTRRKDYLQLLSELEVAERSEKAVKYEYAPTVSFGGFYGVLGMTHGLYHGDFTAQGQVSIPIFHEAEFRGEREVASSQMIGLRQQIASLRDTIDEQIREAMLDVESTQQLVSVAKSNVALSQQVLDDATDRFKAGVDDNLPVVQAQATLAGAQTRLVETLYQYNTAKLTLARNTGVVETRYREYLGK